MSNLYILTTLAAALLVVGVGAFLLLQAPAATEPPATVTGTTLPRDTTAVAVPGQSSPPEERVIIYNAAGRATSVKDFSDDTSVVQDTSYPQRYYLGEQVGPDYNPAIAEESYRIEFLAKDNTFNVTLLEEPLKQTRERAEEYLRTELGLIERQMCGLRYTVTTPYWVSQVYSGTNLLFSFCPGAALLP